MSRYRCVDAQKAAGFPVAAACQAAEVSRAAYYAWVARAAKGASERQRKEVKLAAEIRRIHARSKGTYGAPRVTAELGRRGWKVNHKRVERLMRCHGIAGYRPRRRRSLTKQDSNAAPAPDLLGRLFDPDRPDVPWCGDVTYIPTDQGWLYVLVTWNRMAGWMITNRHHHHELRGPVARECGGEVAGLRAARASGRVARHLDEPGSGAANDRRVCARAGRVSAGL